MDPCLDCVYANLKLATTEELSLCSVAALHGFFEFLCDHVFYLITRIT